MVFQLSTRKQHRKLEDDTYVVFDVETTGLISCLRYDY